MSIASVRLIPQYGNDQANVDLGHNSNNHNVFNTMCCEHLDQSQFHMSVSNREALMQELEADADI